MDGRRFIHAMFTSSKAGSITQVVMNLPGDAAEYLGTSAASLDTGSACLRRPTICGFQYTHQDISPRNFLTVLRIYKLKPLVMVCQTCLKEYIEITNKMGNSHSQQSMFMDSQRRMIRSSTLRRFVFTFTLTFVPFIKCLINYNSINSL